MKLLAVFAAVLLTVTASTDMEQWVAFKQTHGRTYKSLVEERTRFGIFQNNLRKIEQHNAKYNTGEVTYYLGVTPFADQTEEEFVAKLNLQAARKPQLNTTRHVFPENLEIPDSIDWTEKGAVLDVKDQGECGACWAFSATGALEGQNAILNNVKTPLSEQQLLDCSGSYGNGDCDYGGLMDNAFEYVRDHGIVSESDYPYLARQSKCRASESGNTVLKITGYKDLDDTEEALMNAVATIGPISVAINADLLQLYIGGVFNFPFCSKSLDHGVLVVGYGEERGLRSSTKYWKVKNSWGAYWGENGYFRLGRGSDKCGIADQTSYPVLN